jgi:hypothetical protein
MLLLKKGIFKIKNKRGQGVRFVLNPAQKHFLANQTGRDIIIKARQLGFTTLISLLQLSQVMTTKYYSAYMIAHNREDLKYLFDEKIRFAFDMLPEPLRVLYQVDKDNANQLKFENRECFSSSISVGLSARSKTIQFLHISEAAKIAKELKRWQDVIAGSFPAAQQICIESTAEGFDAFYDFVMDQRNNPNSTWKIHFYSWMWGEDYIIDPPKNQSWKDDYTKIARKYFLSLDPVKEYNCTEAQWYFYYTKALELKEAIKSEYPFTIDEAFQGSSRTIFSVTRILEAQIRAKEPIKYENEFAIYELPKKDKFYTLGVDPSTGDGDDESAMSLRDFESGQQVAVFSGKIRSDELARKAYWIGELYNWALIGWERNGAGIAGLERLIELDYPNIYRDIKPGLAEHEEKEGKMGWATSTLTRPVMIDEYQAGFEDEILTVNDKKTLQQMSTFVRKDNGRIEHEDGKHDDCLFADMIAWQMRKYKPFEAKNLYFSV